MCIWEELSINLVWLMVHYYQIPYQHLHHQQHRCIKNDDAPVLSFKQPSASKMEDKSFRLIRPFCITILHHNLSLFIDIFHIMMQYLCYFILICMFDNYWRCITRSLESAGKVPVKTPDFGSPKNSRKIQRSIFSGISHGARRGRRGERQGAGATPCRGST